MPMKKIPTVTHQQKQVRIIKDKTGKHVPKFYEPQALLEARSKLSAHLSPFKPKKPYKVGVRLMVKWCFLSSKAHPNGTYKLTKPDLDNANKLLQDCMTDLGFWKDDSLVASLIIEKFYADIPGIYIRIEAV